MYIRIPTYSTKTDKWTYTEFETREDFKQFVWSKFKPPGELKLYNTESWRQEAIRFADLGYYCNSPHKSKDFLDHWNKEKEKCKVGIIVDDFFLTRYYYFWINYLPINDKAENRLTFPKIWDSQYYFFLYVQLCEIEYKYSVVVKKRQWGGTFQHLAILINDIWFEESYINKIAAYDDEFIKADWSMLDDYRNFLNQHTPWIRHFNPDKPLYWQQRIEVKEQGKKLYRGNKSIIKGLNMKLSPSKGVGGKNNKFYYEEAGITKTMSTTFGYIDPALKLGALTTGLFMASGSVGELDQCEDLKKMSMLNPEGYNVLTIDNNFNEESDYKKVCFFVPEFWSMPPYVDSEGNSMIEEAKQWCIQERERRRITDSPENYRLYISQHPFNLDEAFAWRKESVFPQARIIRQQERIIADKIKPSIVTLDMVAGTTKERFCDNCRPITKFPLGDNDFKEGAIQVWEFPDANPKPFTYFAGIDPISVNKTTTSKSLFSIYVFKNLIEETYTDADTKEDRIKVEGYKMVASYTGRYDDLTKTNEIAEGLLRWYNAIAAVENNVMSFINHMQQKGLQRYLATRDQLTFISELKTNANVYSPYGFKMNETIRGYFIDIINEYISEELDYIRKKNSDEIVKTVYGVERIPDPVLLEELRQYHDKLNVDRFVAFGAGLALMKSYRKYNLGVVKVDKRDQSQELITKVGLPDKSFFKHWGRVIYTQDGVPLPTKDRSYFKNYS